MCRFCLHSFKCPQLVVSLSELFKQRFSCRWFPKTERSRAVGIGMAGFHLGSAIGLLISPIIMARAGIFGPFVIFGLFGFLWVLVWLSATSSSPDRHPQISNYELHYIINNRTTPLPQEKEFGKSRVIPPFKKLLSKMPTWALISANAMHSWVISQQASLFMSRKWKSLICFTTQSVGII